MAIAPFIAPLTLVPASYYAPPAVAPSPLSAIVYTLPPFPSAPVVKTLPSPAVADPAPDAESVSASSLGPVHLTNMITARLSLDNYLLWRAQIFPLLHNHHIDGYIDGTLPCPPKLVSAVTAAGARVSVPNPAYRAWVVQDQAILSALHSSLTEGVAGLVPFALTSQEVWAMLETSFASQSNAHSMAIRRQLGDMKKCDQTASVYFNKIKALTDTLSAIGEPLRDSEFTGFVLAGLDVEYDSLVEVVANAGGMSPKELYNRLLSTEQRIESRSAVDVYGESSANVASRGGGGYRPVAPRPAPTTPGGGHPPAPPAPQQQYQQRPPTPTNNNSGGRPRPTCQLCGIIGHLASRCHKRFRRDFLGIGNDGRGNERQAAMASQGYTQFFPVDSPWYFDTGATDHLMNSLGRLLTQEPYRGTDRVHTADGSGMRITHIGHASLPTSSARTLHLKNVLHVPSVTRNLLSVHKLSRDNNVFVEFHPFAVFVKDRVTRDVLLRGRCCQDLYSPD
jgi:hypothetical protein